MNDLLLITPPFTQLNTPYPATAYLKGFLNTIKVSSYQMDLGIEVIQGIFNKNTFREIFNLAESQGIIQSENAQRIFVLREDYLAPLDDVIAFLQGKNPTYARQIVTENYLPQAARFEQLNDLDWAFGFMGNMDKAKHLATCYLEDLSDFIVECLDDNFGFSRYAERLGQSANSFDELYGTLNETPSFIDEITLSILEEKVKTIQPKIICFSVPFPGNLYSAFRSAQYIKKEFPNIKIIMGGGFPNTELRSLTDIRVFEFFDYITLDDGELPIELLTDFILNNKTDKTFKRTYYCEGERVIYDNSTTRPDYKQSQVGTPDYTDLILDGYISVIEIANPMHSLWSDGRWNKLTMAHGCYWGKCTFCDISLDYIKIYEPIAATLLVDRMEEIIAQTGETGFHFVDEAAPPALMKALALEIIKRKLTVTWWTNIRFEKNFTAALCQLFKASGCIAISGGLEVASDRLLQLIDKGVSVSQVAQVTRNFTEADIMVHAYLMYGYPTQTEQETIDSLEMVRQLFELGVLQSGFWHQFALTAHSPIGLNPDDYGIKPNQNEVSFANNDIDFVDSTGIDHSKFSYGLKKSIFNFMQDIGFDLPLKDWFDFKVPRTSIPRNYIENCLMEDDLGLTKESARIIWLGTNPTTKVYTKSKKGNSWEMMALKFHLKTETVTLNLDLENGEWLVKILTQISINKTTLSELKKDYESTLENFELFWYSKQMQVLKENGLLAI